MKIPLSFLRCTSAGILCLGVVAAWLAMPATAQAQAAEKAVVAEAVPAMPAFNQWVNGVALAGPEAAAPTSVTTMPLTLAATPAQAVAYEPWPLIVGVPDMPLIGTDITRLGRAWGATFNYQGMHARLLVLDSSGRRVEVRPLSAPLRIGERFKIRIATTFDAVADVGQVAGEPWASRRTGQLYPPAGTSVQFSAGETVDLPLGAAEFFTMGTAPSERLVLSVRHAQAIDTARSQQPAYRQDSGSGSSYLQLVPRGTYPAIEQLVSLGR